MKKANLIWIILFISICLTMEWYNILLWASFILLSSSINLTIHELTHFFIGKLRNISTNTIPLGLLNIYKTNGKWKIKLKSEYKNFYYRASKGVNYNNIRNEEEYNEVRKSWAIIAISGPGVNFIIAIISLLIWKLTHGTSLYVTECFIISFGITSFILAMYALLTSDGRAYVGMKKSEEYSAFVIFNNELHYGKYEEKKNSYVIKKLYYISDGFRNKTWSDIKNSKELSLFINVNYCILYNYLSGLINSLPKYFQQYITYICDNRKRLLENNVIKISAYKFLYLLIIYWIVLEKKQEQSLELLIFLEKLNIPKDNDVKYYRALVEEALGIRDNRSYLIDRIENNNSEENNVINLIEIKIKDKMFKLKNDVVITMLN